jgi:hypothetical protein
MRRTVIVSFATAMLFMVICCDADADTGYDLYQTCTKGEDRRDPLYDIYNARCTAYLSGVWESASGIADIYGLKILCNQGAGKIQRGQVVLLFMNWAQRNSQYLGRSAADAAIAAFSDAFPCSTRR